jgi:DNA mismatch repair protein MutL
VVRRIALSRFDLRILFTHNQKKVWLLPAAHQEIAKEGRIARLIHKNFMDQAVKLDYQISTLRLWGWLTLGRLIQPKLNAQYLYINGRFVRDRIITHALREACASVGGISDHMAYILFLELNPDAVDVNVHPTKHEVRFQESRIIHDFIYRAIKQALVSPVASTDPLSPLDGHPMGITVDLPEPVMALPLTPSPPRLPQVLSSSFMQRYIAPNQHLITEAV